ncbi:LysR family transcriptional regulator (plasmid) [Pseudomonas luteola]|uniref:LysR family transcriptional regulator n=1 Tax=Pseudomonas luteola TaxID=47886 RepID=UPI003DA02CAC
MNRNDLRKVDLQLLVIFETLMHERNLTRAAERLFMGQPGVSAALIRLREFFKDPLLVRNGKHMEPTPRALQILERLHPALDGLSSAISEVHDFVPQASKAVFRIGMSDDVECGLLPALLAHIRTVAPGCVLVVRNANFLLLPGLLGSGEVSMGISYTTQLPANAKCRTLRKIRALVIRSDDRPGPLTLEDYCARPHVLVSMSGDLCGNIDKDLARLGRTRQVALGVPHFNGLNAILANSDLLATVPDYAAYALAAGGTLRVEEPPFPIEPANLSLVWRAAQDTDPGERWLRNQIVQFMGASVSD